MCEDTVTEGMVAGQAPPAGAEGKRPQKGPIRLQKAVEKRREEADSKRKATQRHKRERK